VAAFCAAANVSKDSSAADATEAVSRITPTFNNEPAVGVKPCQFLLAPLF